MDGCADHHAERDKPSLKGKISHSCSFVEPRPKMVMTMILIIMGHEYMGRDQQVGDGKNKGY
jgi:hypothetical protein